MDLTARALAELHDLAAASGGKPRPSQSGMAGVVCWAIENREWAVIQAPTGTGKSRAGLLPFLLADGLKLVASTGTLNLMRQYESRDIPQMLDHLRSKGIRRTFAVLKGKSNYACLLAAEAALKPVNDGRLFAVAAGIDKTTERAARWALTAATGDWADAPFEIAPETRTALSVTSDECLRRKCRHFENCHAERARRKADEADAVLVSHALLCVDVASGGEVLPERDAVVIDEFDHLESFAAGVFGSQLSFRRAGGNERGTVAGLGGHLLRLLGPGANPIAERLAAASGQLRSDIDDHLGPRSEQSLSPDDRELVFGPSIREMQRAVDEAADAAAEAIAISEPEWLAETKAKTAIRQVRDLVTDLHSGAPHVVAYVSRTRKTVKLHATNVDIAPHFDRFAWRNLAGDRVPVVATSGTVPAFYAWRLGLGSAQQVDLPSAFDNGSRCLVYVADHIPSPAKATRQQWSEQAPTTAAEIADAALQTGSVLVLCTSWQMTELFAKPLAQLARTRGDFELLVDAPSEDTARMVQRFRHGTRTVLVGTIAGLGRGVDFPGLVRAVIIPAVPYPVPGDPLNDARKALLPSDRGIHPFDRGAAAAALGQAAGRVMRTEDDTGMVAVLDGRVTRSGYATDLQAHLPQGSVVVGGAHHAEALTWLRRGGALHTATAA